jgi:hypothetical protein
VDISEAPARTFRVRPATSYAPYSSAVLQHTQLAAGETSMLWVTLRDRFNNTVPQPDTGLLSVRFNPNNSYTDSYLRQAAPPEDKLGPSQEDRSVGMPLNWVSRVLSRGCTSAWLVG